MPSGSATTNARASSHREPYSVTQLSQLIRDLVENDQRLSNVTVTGEVSDFRRPPSGHHYFSLRDRDASLKCIMFRSGRGGQFLEDGAQVICKGRIGIYVSRGDLQINVSSIEPAGVGHLQAEIDELKRTLANEGLFEQSRKRPIPQFPQRIAVITSAQGAVLQDITNVLKRRYPLLEMVVIPSAVQGAQAVDEIIQAFANLDALTSIAAVDLAILARGGGSLEDLMPFNHELVARTIFASRTPIISAIGHETDYTIADLVADIRAPTPSAAAEIASPDIAELNARIASDAEALTRNLSLRLSHARDRFEITQDRLADAAIDTYTYRNDVQRLLDCAKEASLRSINAKRETLHRSQAELHALGPMNTLRRGFSIARIKSGPVLTHAQQVTPGDIIELTFADGKVDAEAKSTHTPA